jgi:hypothetical protein
MAKELFACAPIVLGLSVVLGAARPVCAASPPEVLTTLELDTRILDAEAGARIEADLAEQMGPSLASVGYVVASDPATTSTVVRVRVIAFDHDTRDYEVEVRLGRPGTEFVGSTIVCNACSENRLVGRIVEETPKLLEAEEDAPTIEPVEFESAVEPTAGRRKVRAMGPMGITGVGLGAVGIAVASVGVRWLARGEVDVGPTEDSVIAYENYRARGVTAAALGGVTLIVGAVLVAVDVKRRQQARRQYDVHVSPAYVGFQFEHRF